jgi:hypothetical protein
MQSRIAYGIILSSTNSGVLIKRMLNIRELCPYEQLDRPPLLHLLS